MPQQLKLLALQDWTTLVGGHHHELSSPHVSASFLVVPHAQTSQNPQNHLH